MITINAGDAEPAEIRPCTCSVETVIQPGMSVVQYLVSERDCDCRDEDVPAEPAA